MPQPILVGYDPAAADYAPVRFGAAAARFTGAPLIIGAVTADLTLAAGIAFGHVDEALTPDAEEPLDRVRAELIADGIRAEVRAFPGTSAPRALHEAAEELGVRLLVVGSTDRGHVGRLLPGSTADRLMHGAPCPIAVVPHGWEQSGDLETIGVAFVDTPEGADALRGAVALARRRGAKLRLLSAVKPRQFGREAGGRPGHERTTFDETGRELRAAAEKAAKEAAELAPELEIEPDTSAQDPADFLIAASQGLDLLVCGSRGYGPQRAVLLGGVTRRVTAEAHCPVIVLVRGVGASLEALVAESSQSTA